MTHKILVLSDLHLGEEKNDPRYTLFLSVLDKFIESDIHELILMGDIFDILIGNKKFWKNIHPSFFKSLERALNKKKIVTWVQGNHDLQLSKLLKPLGVYWIENHEILVREKLRISLSHGDLADKSNKLHPLWRSFLNSKVMSLFIHFIPEHLGEKRIYPLTLRLSQASRRVSFNNEANNNAKNTFRQHAQELQAKFNADLVILGHSHISDELALPNSGTYLNLGSWLDTPELAVIDIHEKSLEIKVSPASYWLQSTSKQ